MTTFETSLYTSSPDIQAASLRAAIHLALTTSLEDLSGLGELRTVSSYHVLIDDENGHFPTQIIEPCDVLVRHASLRGPGRLFVVSKILSRQAHALSRERASKPQQSPKPREFTFRLSNLAAIQAAPTERQQWDTM